MSIFEIQLILLTQVNRIIIRRNVETSVLETNYNLKNSWQNVILSWDVVTYREEEENKRKVEHFLTCEFKISE